MARNLLRAGFPLTVEDLVPDRVAALVADGATAAAPGPVEEHVVMLSVPAPQHVEAACLGEAGLLARMRPGSVLVNLSTVNLDGARALEAACAERGILCVDAPVTGAADGAADGTLTIMCGASDEALAAARPQLEAALGSDYAALARALSRFEFEPALHLLQALRARLAEAPEIRGPNDVQ